jgi:hypothetical protein
MPNEKYLERFLWSPCLRRHAAHGLPNRNFVAATQGQTMTATWSNMTMEATKEDFEDAAQNLIAAADYLKTELDAGRGVYESKWLGAVMEAHRLLLEVAQPQESGSSGSAL